MTESTPKPKKPLKPKAGRRTAQVDAACVELTSKQARFVDEYLVDLNATQAAIRAGYSAKTAKQIGTENLAKPAIQSAIAEGRKLQEKRTGITADRVLQEIARVALSDPRRIMSESGEVLKPHEIDDDTAAALASFEVDDDGIKYKFWDKNSALEKLAKHLGLYAQDNGQKVDPLASLLAGLSTGTGNGFKPVSSDPEHEDD